MARYLIGLAAVLFLAGCGEKETAPPQKAAEVVKPTAEIPVSFVNEFSGENALTHIKTLTSFGPRPPESEGYRKSLAYLKKTLGELGWQTTQQDFKSVTPIGPLNFSNLIARFAPEGDVDWEDSVPFVVGSHLDTKRYISITFLGVNDSGSSTGVLVEMARVLAQNPAAARQVELVFFDGEEAILTNIRGNDGLYGSRYYAAQLNRRKRQPSTGMVLDLVGDARVPLLIGIDSPKPLQAHAVKAAKTLGLAGKNVKMATQPIIDDHVPLINRGNLPTLHLIGDFNKMPYWHTKNDTLEQISAEGLNNSGKLALQVLSQLSQQD